MGYQDEGTFDIRLEKGCMSLEGNPWRWHFDGEEIFKTSITVCYSNKKNWSTRVGLPNERPADHGFLYDALKVYHRAPIPFDLKGEEVNADDYRLFIRYNEFYKKSERPISNRDAAAKADRNATNFPKNPFEGMGATEKKIPPLPSDFKSIPEITLQCWLSKDRSPIIPLSKIELISRELISKEDTFAKISESLLKQPPLDLTTLNVPKYDFSGLLAELTST